MSTSEAKETEDTASLREPELSAVKIRANKIVEKLRYYGWLHQLANESSVKQVIVDILKGKL